MATRRRNSVIFTPEDCLKWREPHLKPPTFHQWSRHRQEVWLLVHGIEDLTPLGWEYLRVQGGLSRGPQPLSSTLLLRLLHRGKSRVQHLGVCSVNACTLLEVLIAKAFHLVRGEVQYCRRLGWLHEGLYEPDQDDYQRRPLLQPLIREGHVPCDTDQRYAVARPWRDAEGRLPHGCLPAWAP